MGKIEELTVGEIVSYYTEIRMFRKKRYLKIALAHHQAKNLKEYTMLKRSFARWLQLQETFNRELILRHFRNGTQFISYEWIYDLVWTFERWYHARVISSMLDTPFNVWVFAFLDYREEVKYGL